MTFSAKKLYESLPLNEGVSILAANADGLVALEKPDGILSHPNDATDIRRALLKAAYNLSEERYEWLGGDGASCFACLLNRLDSPTSGVVLIGLDQEVSALVKEAFASHLVTKTYYALVRGRPKQDTEVWSDRIPGGVYSKKTSPSGQARISAETKVERLHTSAGPSTISLLRLLPLTGRTHQLRIQCQKRGLPIIGDQSYGDFSFNRQFRAQFKIKRMMLHSGETALKYTIGGKNREFRARSELPDCFLDSVGERGGSNASSKHSSVLKGRRFKV